MAPNQHTLIKKGLFGIILIFLWLVILQDLFDFKKVKPLFGYFPTPQDTVYTWNGWMNGKFQKTREEWLQNEFSLREDYVRLHNSMEYSFFHSTNIWWIEFGKDHHLMDQKQITAYLGGDTVSFETANQQSIFVAALQDTLKKLGKNLYICIPPTKPGIFPEYIPASFPPKKGLNNYEKYKAGFINNHAQLLDFVELFKAEKTKGNTSLFPKNGSHWNTYGALLAWQILIQKISENRNVNLGSVKTKRTYYGVEHWGELDIYATLNLMIENIRDTTLYVDAEIQPSDTTKPRAFFCTDSFFASWINFGAYELLDSTTYCFYNNRVLNLDHTETIKTFTPQELLSHYDVYVVVCNESNLKDFGWGFIEQLYFYFYPLSPNRAYYDPQYRKEVLKIMKDIKKDEKYMEMIRKKAANNHKDPSRQLYEDAVWIVNNKQNN